MHIVQEKGVGIEGGIEFFGVLYVREKKRRILLLTKQATSKEAL